MASTLTGLWLVLLPCKLLCPPHTFLPSSTHIFHWGQTGDWLLALFLKKKHGWKEWRHTKSPPFVFQNTANHLINMFTMQSRSVSPHKHLFHVHLICSYSPMQLSVAFCHSPELPHTETLPPLQLWYPSTQRWITTLLLCHTTSELARKGTGPHLAGKQWHWLVN